MIRKRQYLKRWLLFLVSVLLVFTVASGILYVKFRPLIYTAAKSNAKTIFLNAANEAVVNVLAQNDICYDNIAVLARDGDGRVTSLEIDTVKVNFLKSKISFEIAKIIAVREYYDVKIPLGTLFGSEYTNGLGPRLSFKMQLAPVVFVDFEHEFSDAGINQVLHRVVIKIRVTGSILAIGAREDLVVETSAIAAQTVIVGSTPGAVTEISGLPDDGSAGLIKYYEAK